MSQNQSAARAQHTRIARLKSLAAKPVIALVAGGCDRRINRAGSRRNLVIGALSGTRCLGSRRAAELPARLDTSEQRVRSSELVRRRVPARQPWILLGLHRRSLLSVITDR
jgi:hypothetical protein